MCMDVIAWLRYAIEREWRETGCGCVRAGLCGIAILLEQFYERWHKQTRLKLKHCKHYELRGADRGAYPLDLHHGPRHDLHHVVHIVVHIHTCHTNVDMHMDMHHDMHIMVHIVVHIVVRIV